ncbi:Membrane steroid-binding protein 2 [Capsicum annuum]|nr:Membrane steroid-binding protein 2 [Capsicum annuum]KAF3654074.1 Membrane steroid-binding protein 2 [Capsicum annuum]
MFYGLSGSYAIFSGRDASLALAKLSFKPEDINGNLEGLSDAELEILLDWEYKFLEKYARVGQLVPKKTPTKNKAEQSVLDQRSAEGIKIRYAVGDRSVEEHGV